MSEEQQPEIVEPQKRGIKVIANFFKALRKEEHEKLRKLVHPSLLNEDGSDFLPNVKNFTLRRVVRSSRMYEIPPQIHEVHRNPVETIGEGENAETGYVEKYFVVKKPGWTGMPAPVSLFWREGSDEDPRLIDFGSI